jgi:hypothetical protein|tara:strand:+ start:371 stop:721 length:351 start_codon:yes stop_codon:yes gene_type:complete
MDREVTIEDVQHFIRAKSEIPLIHVRGMDDPIYKNMEDIVLRIWPDTEKHPYAIASQIKEIMFTFQYMEDYDKDKIINTFAKYQVKGESGGIHGERTYGYDKSRIDRSLIRRKRGN